MSNIASQNSDWERLFTTLGEWTLEELPQNAREVAKGIDETNASLAVGVFLPALFMRMIELLGTHSSAIRVSGLEGQLFASFAKLLNPAADSSTLHAQLATALMPASFPGGPIHVLPLCGMLDVGNDFQWSRILNDESAQFLQSRAVKLLNSAPEGIDDAVALRWHEIAQGHFPLGFNTKTEERWLAVDMRKALVPNQPLFQTSLEMLAYLKRAATEKLHILAETNEVTPEMKAHLESIINASDLDVTHCIPKHITY